MAMTSGWTWAKLVIGGAWLAMALFEQRRGPSIGTHWTAPAIGGGWLVLSALVMFSAPGAALGFSVLTGLTMMGLGALLRVQAIRALGDGYSDGVRPLRPRVRDGVYGYLDHPGELGALLLATGACVAVGSPWALVWTLASLLPLTLYRFRLEEGFLRRDASATGEGADSLAL